MIFLYNIINFNCVSLLINRPSVVRWLVRPRVLSLLCFRPLKIGNQPARPPGFTFYVLAPAYNGWRSSSRLHRRNRPPAASSWCEIGPPLPPPAPAIHALSPSSCEAICYSAAGSVQATSSGAVRGSELVQHPQRVDSSPGTTPWSISPAHLYSMP
jgi:hypothetical protein